MIAEAEGASVGAAWGRAFAPPELGPLDDPSVPVLAIATEKRWRGRGVGGLLMRELLRRCEADGVDRIDLSTGAFNEAGVRLYRSVGFVETLRVGDAIRMRLTL